MNNTTTTYGSYPFSPDGYICLAKIEDASVDHLVYATTGKRDQWFKTEIQGIWMQDIGFGSWITFKGQLYRFIGVHCEDWMIIDGHNVLNGLRLGLSLSLVQSDPFSLSAYGQWNLWSGVLERNGGTLGLDIDSFPVKPVALHFKAGFQLFRNYSMGELEAQIGILFGSLECFVGWRYWNLINDGGSTAYKFNGAFGGLRLYY